MNISEEIAKLKKTDGFNEKVGMILIHNGIVRATSKDGKIIKSINIESNFDKIEEIRKKYSKRDGIFKIIIEAKSGELKIGDDLLFIIVAGNYREHVKAVLSDVLEEVKTSAVTKEEVF